MTDVIPIFKKEKANYRPIGLLPSLSKVYEEFIYQQLSTFFENKLSPLLCGFRSKLHAYGVDIKSLKLLQDYLSSRTQKVKLDSTLSSWLKIILGVPMFYPWSIIFQYFPKRHFLVH